MKVNKKIIVIVSLTLLLATIATATEIGSAQRYSWCYLNVSKNMASAGNIAPGSGSFYYGDYVVVRVYTNPGYSFDGWYLNGVYQGKLSSIGVTMIQDHQLHAVFSKRIVSLTITANPPLGGTIAPGTGVWNYTYGDSVTIKQFTNPSATFSGWYLDGVYQGLGTGITVLMDQDHQVSAFFSGVSQVEPTPTATPIPTSTPPPISYLPTPTLPFYCTSSTLYSGFNVKIQGKLVYNDVGISGAGILLAYSVTGGATWQDFAYINTDDLGDFNAVWMPSASGNYLIKATWPGDDMFNRVTRTVSFAVTPSLDEKQSVFSVASNSTLSSLTFDSTKNELRFNVKGPDGTAGYVQVCVPTSLVSDASKLLVTLDGQQISYDTLLKNDVWIVTLIYQHSEHKVVMALNADYSPLNAGSLNSDLLFPAIIIVLVAIIAGLIIVNIKKSKAKKILE